MALAWNVAAGYAGQFSLGHSLFYGIGAYASTMLYLRLGLTPWAGMFVGAALAGIVGALLALGGLPLQGARHLLRAGDPRGGRGGQGARRQLGLHQGAGGILLTMQNAPGDFFFLRREPYYYVALAMLVAMIVISLLLERSPLGQYFLAVREDEQAAEASGVDSYRYKTIAISLSAALTAFAGASTPSSISTCRPNGPGLRAAAHHDARHHGRRRGHRLRARHRVSALQRARRGAPQPALPREHARGRHREQDGLRGPPHRGPHLPARRSHRPRAEGA